MERAKRMKKKSLKEIYEQVLFHINSVFPDILRKEYLKVLRSESQRCHPEIAYYILIYLSLKSDFDLPEDRLSSLIRKIITFSPRDPIIAFLALHIPGLPLEFQEMNCKILHSTNKPNKISPLAYKTIKKLFGIKWILFTTDFKRRLENSFEEISISHENFWRVGNEFRSLEISNGTLPI
jgi:hypothetical protein